MDWHGVAACWSGRSAVCSAPTHDRKTDCRPPARRRRCPSVRLVFRVRRRRSSSVSSQQWVGPTAAGNAHWLWRCRDWAWTYFLRVYDTKMSWTHALCQPIWCSKQIKVRLLAPPILTRSDSWQERLTISPVTADWRAKQRIANNWTPGAVPLLPPLGGPYVSNGRPYVLLLIFFASADRPETFKRDWKCVNFDNAFIQIGGVS